MLTKQIPNTYSIGLVTRPKAEIEGLQKYVSGGCKNSEKKMLLEPGEKKWQALRSGRKFSKTVTCSNIKIKNMHNKLMELPKKISTQITKSAN